MKRLSLLLPLFLLVGSTTPKVDRVELTDWQFEYNGQWYPATVPGFIHTDLMANGIIPDPYFGTKEDSVQWVSKEVWTYQVDLSKVTLPKGDTLWVVFEGLEGLKDPNGADKFIVTKIVYENDTLAFTLTDNGTNEEISVTMGVAPEGFETDKLSSFDIAEQAEAADNNETPSPAKAGPWDCACGTHNTGNFCTACGSPRKNN